MNLMTNIFKLTNTKICQLYKTFSNLYSKLDDEFFTFNDFNGNEAVLYSDQGRIFVPSCVAVEEIDVVEKTNACYRDFPVKIRIGNRTVNAFMTNEKIIKVTSKKASCKNNYQNVHLTNTHRMLVKMGNLTTLEYDDVFMHLTFNLQTVNVTKLNFMHDENILNSVDLVMKLANVTAITEESGIFHIAEDFHSETESKIREIVDNTINLTSTWISKVANYGIKGLAGLFLILAILFLICKLFILY